MQRFLPLVLVILLFAAAGCGDDAAKPAPPSNNDGLIHGEIGDTDFEFTIPAAGSSAHVLEGPFVLRGTNLHYDGGAGALVVDLTVLNHGVFAHPEPVGLTFIDLIPSTVTVLNPDNGIHGDGAAIVFPFANDDGVWTPGESSLPRTVQFGVEQGVSIGFVARLDIGSPLDGGTIAGLVWNDANEDGVIDDGEPGVPGVEIHLRPFSDHDDSTTTREFRSTVTGPDGRYAFDGLAAGAYVVSRSPFVEDCFPTTPLEIHVLLVEVDGEVMDFLDANFGCVPSVIPPPPLPIGQHVEVTGKFYEPDVFVVFSFQMTPCPGDSVPPDGYCPRGRMRGPVTAIGRDTPAFRVMNTSVNVDESTIGTPPDQIGERLDVQVHRPDRLTWTAAVIEDWLGPHEEIHGPIDDVMVDPSGVVRVLVLDTWLTVPNITVGRR